LEARENLRGSGILLSISSLPSPYGIGTLGREAYNFVDLLGDLKQKYWQVLPVGPPYLAIVHISHHQAARAISIL
jgi:4-alpha-glucanotransferase